jgi:hypothetical protein
MIPLAEIDFPLGLEGTDKLPQTRRALRNCWNAAGPIIQRPGISSVNTITGVARGGFEWNGSLYGVYSNDLVRIDPITGVGVVIDTITGTRNIDFAIGFNDAVIIVKGGDGYTLDKSDVLTQIVSPQFLPSDSVTHINGRFVYVPTDGSPAFFSDVGAGGTIQTTSFFDAEELPDKNKVCVNFRNVLYIGGEDSFEQFRDFGDQVGTTIPFRRLNARTDNGYLGGLLEYNNTFLFIGKEKKQDVGIYSISQGVAPKISNEYIDSILTTYSEEELARAVTGRIKWHGYDIATFTLARDAFGFLGGNWFGLDTLLDGHSEVWHAGFITQFDRKYYSMFQDNFGRFDAINTDYGSPFVRLIDMAFETDNEFSAQSLEYRLSQGFNTGIGSVALQLSDNNVLYSDVFHRNTGDVGKYTNKLSWNYPGGMGYYEGFMGIRLFTGEDIDFSASKLIVELR